MNGTERRFGSLTRTEADPLMNELRYHHYFNYDECGTQITMQGRTEMSSLLFVEYYQDAR